MASRFNKFLQKFVKNNGLWIMNDVSRDNSIGRWALKTDKHSKINNYWQSIDHCGDSICGNVILTKKFLDNELKKIKE
jgi:hypothetical protein